MTQHWLSWAEAQHKNLQIDLEQLLQAYDLVRAAIGREWIEHQERRAALAHVTVADFHPLYRDLNSSTNQAVVAVAELAKYLEHFTGDPALPAVLDDLRSDKFPSSFFELAMAHRWKKAGAQVTLQPATPKGKLADFQADIHEAHFFIECSVSPDDTFQEPSFRIPSLVVEAITSAVDEPIGIAAKVTLREFAAGDWQGDLRKAVKRLSREVVERAKSSTDTGVTEDAGPWLLEMEAISETTEPIPGFKGWDVGFRAVDRPKEPGEPSYKVLEEKRGREKARVFLKLPPNSEDPNDKILRKLKKETRQLSGIPDPRVVLLDLTGVSEDILKFVGEDIQDRILTVMRGIPELACVWLMSRGWSTALRFQYRAAYLPNPESIYQLPESISESLGNLEWKWDFVTEREIPWLPEDEAQREWQRRSYPAAARGSDPGR